MVRFSCEKALVQQAVAAVSRAVAAKSSIPALEGILLECGEGLRLSGYNMQTGIRTTVEAAVSEAGHIVLNARLFGEMIRRLPDDIVVFSADEKYVVKLVCGDASFELPGLSADDYPELPEVDDQFSVTLEQRTLKAMINQTSFAVSVNEARPIHTGALFEIGDAGLTMVAVDGFRLALRREPLERIDGGAFRFVAPGSALKEVESICGDTEEVITITQGKRHLMFAAGSTELICRRLEGEFLDWRRVLPQNQPIKLAVNVAKMTDSIERVGLIISEKLKSPVRCRFGENTADFRSVSTIGEAHDVCQIAGDGQDMEIGFNCRYLLDALRVAAHARVVAHDLPNPFYDAAESHLFLSPPTRPCKVRLQAP